MLISWQSHIGKYLHKCDECGDEFVGRKNQLYCNAKCKAKHNNELAAIKLSQERIITDSILRNAQIIDSMLHGKEGDILNVKMELLKAKGFDPDAPKSTMIMDGDLWYKIDQWAFRPIEQLKEVELYKIP